MLELLATMHVPEPWPKLALLQLNPETQYSHAGTFGYSLFLQGCPCHPTAARKILKGLFPWGREVSGMSL